MRDYIASALYYKSLNRSNKKDKLPGSEEAQHYHPTPYHHVYTTSTKETSDLEVSNTYLSEPRYYKSVNYLIHTIGITRDELAQLGEANSTSLMYTLNHPFNVGELITGPFRASFTVLSNIGKENDIALFRILSYYEEINSFKQMAPRTSFEQLANLAIKDNSSFLRIMKDPNSIANLMRSTPEISFEQAIQRQRALASSTQHYQER